MLGALGCKVRVFLRPIIIRIANGEFCATSKVKNLAPKDLKCLKKIL